MGTRTALTAPQRRTLQILQARVDAGAPTSPRWIARDLWPDSPAWQRRAHRLGTAGAVGATMPMKAAALLWRLAAQGLAEQRNGSTTWTITDKGRAALDPNGNHR